MNPQISRKLMLALVIFYGIVYNIQAQEYDLDTDLEMHWPTPQSPKPDYLGHIFDPAFGTKIVRITGDPGTPVPNLNENWRNTARHSYSIKQTWNADESVMYINRHRDIGGGYGSAMFLDGQTYEVLNNANIMPSGGNESRWHPTDPNLRIILYNDSFRSWNYFTDELIELMSWTGYSNTQLGPWTGNLSDDGSMAAVLATRNSDNKLVGFAVDMVNNIKYPDIDFSSIPNLDYISISPLGNYILVNGNFGTGSDRTKIYDLEGNQVGPFWSGYGQPSHFDMTVDDNGDEIAVGVDKSNNVTGGRIIKRRLSDGLVTQITTDGYVSHTTARALGRPGWVYASTGSSTASSKWLPYLNEIIAVKLDGSRVERICHSRNLYTNYENQAHPSPSPSGSRVVFASDWRSGNVPIQCYVADFRDNLITTGNQVVVSSDANNDTICEGQEVILSASNADSYVWDLNGETTETITVSPDVTTTYTVTGTHSDGSTTEAQITITVNEMPTANAGEDVETCQGTEVTLTATGGTSYEWSTGESTQSIIVNPNVTATFSVEVTQNNCTSTDSVVVTVNDVPDVDAGEDVTIFIGESATLTATGADSYLWSTGETTQTISVNPVLDTSYSVTGTIGSCENSDTITVFLQDDSVNANAGNDTEICIGETTTLTATGGTTYLWSTGETTASIDVSPNTTTTYTVTAFSVSGTNQEDDSVIVTVNEIPDVSAGANVVITVGESTTLTATGADSYLWQTGETTASIEVSPNVTTVYTVTGYSNNCEASANVTVSVDADTVTADAGVDVDICDGESTTLTATGGVTYLWNTGETTANIEVSPNVTTTYTVTVYNASGTSSDEDSVIVTVNELPATDAGSNVVITIGESTTLMATGADSYLWETGETTASIVVSPNVTTVYTVTGYSNNCESSANVTVSVEIDTVIADAGEDVTICNGETTTLTASGGVTYLWSTGETSESINVNPNATTTYTVTVYNASETSSDEDSVIVTVNELPAINAGNDVTITEGSSTTLTATGADTYLWNTGETTASISVNPTTTTEYSVTGFSNGCEATDAILVTVEPFVFEASAGANQVICQGYSTTLTASEGDAYLWSTGETTQSITVSPTGTQTYTVTVYEGEYEDDADVTVSVNPNPNVIINDGGEVMILEGEFVTLSATGANSYLWNNGATQPNIAVSPSGTTTYEVTGYINDCEDTNAIVVNVVEAVQADAGEDLIICSEETVTLTATGGDEYLWNTGETTQSIEVSPDADTEYSVLVYNALDSDEDSVIVFVESCNTIENIPPDSSEFGFVVYPDPIDDVLKVKIDGLESVTAKGISIYDMTGKVLYTELFNASDLENQSEMTRLINTSTFASGIYVVRLLYNDTSVLKKIPIR
nr:T9SS type A sorting domain-containing protein [uncultured Psychroserpens sp.]